MQLTLFGIVDLYDESCLVENPYFYVTDMECWPCQGVTAILNISKVEANSIKSGSGSPFITKVRIFLDSLFCIYPCLIILRI